MTRMTQHPRYFPTIVWSKTQVVHNVFRAFEYLFGRAFGANGEGDTISASMEVYDKYAGEVLVERVFVYRSLEARLTQYEDNVKNFFWHNRYLLPIPMIALLTGEPLFFVVGAIAFGAISSVTTTSNPTSVALSGSDPLGLTFVAGESSSDAITAVSWNSVGMNKIRAVQTPADRWISNWWLQSPGSSTTIQYTGGTFWRSCSFYYTGCAQSGQVDSSASNTSTATTVISVTTTVVASNCWLVMCQKDVSGGKTYTPSNALTQSRLNADAGGLAIADSGGTVSTGSVTGTMTCTGNSDHGAIAFSIAPVATTTIKTWDGIVRANLKTLDGVASASIKSINGIQ